MDGVVVTSIIATTIQILAEVVADYEVVVVVVVEVVAAVGNNQRLKIDMVSSRLFSTNNGIPQPPPRNNCQ